jgi:phosphoribosyl-AMP cyclohydrolase
MTPPVAEGAALEALVAEIRFDRDGLVPVIAQQHDTGEVLMCAWMNAASVRETLTTGWVCYWSRSRGRLWRKGESSGQRQTLVELRVDCDGDTLLARVDQQGVACHTGRRACFYRAATSEGWAVTAPVLVPPEALYGEADNGAAVGGGAGQTKRR